MRPGPGSTRDLAQPSHARLVASWLQVAAWAALVWWLGSGEFGAPATSRFIEPLLAWLLPDMPPPERAQLAIAVRKLAHPTVYGVFAALTFRAIRVSGRVTALRGAALAFALSLSLAAFDESRQVGLRNRTGSVSDVVLDSAGALGALAVGVLRARRRPEEPVEGDSR